MSEGRILLEESPIRPTAIHLRRKIMLLDDFTGPGRRPKGSSVSDLCDTLQNYQVDRPGIENEVADWFDTLDLTSVYHALPGEMSKGQAYKIAMIGLFVVAPPIWLLDEPFSAGLDANGLRMLEEQMANHAASGGIVLFSSQWPQHARRLADWALVLHEGSLEWSAAPNELPKVAGPPPALQAILQGLGPA